MEFDIITYANGAFLYDVFNGIASIFGGDDYAAALKTSMLAASIGIMVSAVLQGRMANLYWFLQVIFLYLMLIVPKVTVNIVDRVEVDVASVSGHSVRRVDNVPIGVALTASGISTFSAWMTDSFETVFSLPSGMQYSQHGPLFGQALVSQALSYKVNDANLLQSLQNYWQSCIFYDIALGFYDFDTLAKQPDLLTFLASNSAATRGFYMQSSSGQTFYDCRSGITPLRSAITAEINNAKGLLGNNASSTLPSSNTLATSGWTTLPVAFQYLSGISASATDILMQSAMMNSMDGGLSMLAGNADAQAAIQGYAIARAERERDTTFGTMGKMAGDMMPILKNLIEGLVYAVFPLVGLALMFPNGWKSMGYYARILVWVGLWPVSFALLHYAMTFFGSMAMSKAACLASGMVCTNSNVIYTQMGMIDVLRKYEAIAGYLMTMIPMVTWVMVSQGGAMMASLVGRVLDGYAQPASQAAGEATAGNFTLGNVNYENLSAFQHNTAPAQSVGYSTQNDGMMKTTTAATGQTVEQTLSKLAVTPTMSKSFENAATQSLENATSYASATTASLAEARGAAIREAFDQVRGGSQVTSAGSSTQSSDQHTWTSMIEALRSSAERYADGQRWSKEEKEAFVNDTVKGFSLGGQIGLQAFGNGVSAGGRTEDRDTTTKETSESSAIARERIKDFLASEQGREALATVHSISSSSQSSTNRTSSTSETNQTSRAYDEAKRVESVQSEALQRLEAARSLVQEAEKSGFSIDTNETGALIRYFRESGLKDEQWEQGVIDLSTRMNTADAQAVMRVVDEYFKDKVDLRLDAQSAREHIEAEGQNAIGTLKQHDVTSKLKDDAPIVIPQGGKLARAAEKLAQLMEHKADGEEASLNTAVTAQTMHLDQSLASGRGRIGNAVDNKGEEGAYPIPPDDTRK